MGHLKIFILTTALLKCVFAAAPYSSDRCPPKYKVYNDKPTCHTDADCQRYGKICCPNQFNAKSCTDRAPWYNGKMHKKATSSGIGGTAKVGIFCDGVKCRPWEVCKPDYFTKKLRCQQA